MGIISIRQKGSFANIERYLGRPFSSSIKAKLDKYGVLGVEALVNATPQDSGLTAESWYYEIVERPGYISIRWHNRNVQDGIPIAILLQYGHGTRNGGYVEGRDYIMPAIQPVFDQILADTMKEVTK